MSIASNIVPDFTDCRVNNVFLKLAETPEELVQVKILRHYCFFEEPKGVSEPSGALDQDEFDENCEHMLVMDDSEDVDNPKVVGTYRLLRRDAVKQTNKFYTETEFDISKLKALDCNLLELGRSCIHPAYRDGKVIQLLWKGLGTYLAHYKISYMFGCASFHGNDVSELNDSLSYLMSKYKAPEDICPVALDSCKVEVDLKSEDDIDRKDVFVKLPALLKGYIRAGCMVGEGAVKDEYCNTIDVCILMDTSKIAKKYSQRFVE